MIFVHLENYYTFEVSGQSIIVSEVSPWSVQWPENSLFCVFQAVSHSINIMTISMCI